MDNNGADYSISLMLSEHLDEYAELYAGAFSASPWNEPWTAASASKRIGAMMSAPTFIGLSLCSEDELKGFIFGQIEFTHSGAEFQIQEFCVASASRRKGYGAALLAALREKLASEGVTGGIYLITSHGDSTEGWYSRHGFRTMEDFIVMNDTRE